jgi:hypothetical protein
MERSGRFMKITVCDVCGTRDHVRTLSLFIERKYNGVDDDNIYDMYDLCPMCEIAAIGPVYKYMDQRVTIQISQNIKDMINAKKEASDSV